VAGLILLNLFLPDAFYIFVQSNFTLNVICGLAISAVSFAGAIAYEFDRLHLGFQVAMHVAIVLVVAVPIAFVLDWFVGAPPIAVAIFITVWVVLFFVTWLGFYLYGNREVNKINEKIRERESKQ